MDSNALFWKSKAAQKSAENKELKKRIKDVIYGRENWKEKYKLRNEEVINYKREIDSIKKR